MHEAGPREVRLRREFAGRYPEIPAGTWLPSARWAEAIVVRAREARHRGEHIRTFDPRHFDFRGGAPARPPAERHLRTRAEDGV
jgi:hypothetical protein